MAPDVQTGASRPGLIRAFVLMGKKLNRFELGSLFLAAGEAAALVLIIATAFPCERWPGGVVTCPPPLWLVLTLGVGLYLGCVGLFWFLFHRPSR